MKTVRIKIKGLSPTMLHSDRAANPLDPMTKKYKALTSKKKKTDDDHAAIARAEWELGLYFDEKVGPHYPGRNIKALLLSAAKKTKDGPRAKCGLIIMEDKVPVIYDGPRTIKGLWDAEEFADIRSVVVQQKKTMRCRPIFREWEMEFSVVYDPAVLDKSDVVRFAETGGQLIGMGDYRVEKSGDFGRYEVVEVKDV